MRLKAFGSAMKVIIKNWKNNGTLVLENFLNQVFFFETENPIASRDWHIQQKHIAKQWIFILPRYVSSLFIAVQSSKM